MATMDYRFELPSGQAYDFDVTKATDVVVAMWRNDVPARLPWQLLNRLDENVVLRFVESMPPDLAELCPSYVEVQRNVAPGVPVTSEQEIIAHAICAKAVKGGWRLLWTVPLFPNGSGELLIWDHLIADEVMELFR